MSHLSVTSGRKSVYIFHENTTNGSRNFAKRTSLEYLFYKIGEYFDQSNIISMQRVRANMFSW